LRQPEFGRKIQSFWCDKVKAMPIEDFFALLKKHLSEKDLTRMMEFTNAMAPERRVSFMQFLAERETHAPVVGADAPDFELPKLGDNERVQLSAFRGYKPVALIFGSYT
jgi:hypothetical protein